MTVDEQFDYVNTLRWVKGELDETLKEARHALEAFVEHPTDIGHITRCAELLRDTQGTLQMLEIYGAALLAEEMEAVARDLEQGDLDRREDACEVLMRAILQLPDYLERLRSGYRDIPLVLLPLMNDLRAARGTNLLSEGSLFLPELSIEPVRHSELRPSADNIEQLARKLRSRYQFGLVGWYKNSKDMISLKRLAWVLSQFEQNCRNDECLRLFWVANGAVEGIMFGVIDSSTSVKWLLGQVDWQIKSMMESGENALIQTPPNELLKNLLFYVGRAQPKGNRIPELQKAFSLQNYVPRDDEMSSAAASIGGANAALMETVSSVLKEDLAKVEDAVDLYTRGDNKNTEQLNQLVGPLRNISDTLGMLGLGALRQLVLQQVQSIEQMFHGSVSVEENRMMEVASTLVYVKSALNDISWHQAREMPGISAKPDAEHLPNPEYRQTRAVVIKEALEEIAKVKDKIVGFINGPFDSAQLETVPGVLNAVRGALSVLMAERISNLIVAALTYIDDKWIKEHVKPAPEQQDLLADSIAGVEYSLEAMAEERPVSGFALDFCERSMATLGYPVSGWQPETGPAGADADTDEVVLSEPEDPNPVTDTDQTFGSMDIDEQNPFAADVEDVQPMPLEDNTDTYQFNHASENDNGIDFELSHDDGSDGAEITREWTEEIDLSALEQNESAPLELQGHDFSPSHEQPNEEPLIEDSSSRETSADQEDDDDVDHEIVEVFIEEADEELSTIAEHYPKWKNNQEDDDSLKITRRSFHTLKGSGRLVGASSVGEFAWSVENLLNKVIDQKIVIDQRVFGIMDEVLQALPELIAAFKQRKRDVASSAEVVDLTARAHALADGTGTQTQADQPAAENNPIVADHEQRQWHEHEAANEGGEQESLTLSGDDLATPGEEIDLSGDELALSGDDLSMPGDELELSGDELELSGDELELSGDTQNSEGTQSIELTSVDDNTESESMFGDADLEFNMGALDEHDEIKVENISLDLDDAEPLDEPAQEPALVHSDSQSRDSDDEVDLVLFEIFNNEAKSHLEEIRKFISSCGGGEAAWAVNDDMMRAMHTLHGSSHMAGFDDIAAVSGAIEDYIMVLRNNERLIDQAGLDVIRHFVSSVERTSENLLSTLGRLTDRKDQLAQIAALNESAIPAAKADSGGLEFVMDWSAEQGQEQVQESFDEQASEQDELEEIFLMEATEIMDSTEAILQQWSSNPEDKNLSEQLERELHTFKGGARLAGFSAMADLSHELETVLSAFRDGRLAYSDVLLDLVQQTYDRLSGYLDKARNHETQEPSTQLIEQIAAFAQGRTMEVEDHAQPVQIDLVEVEPDQSGDQGDAQPGGGSDDVQIHLAEEPQLLFPETVETTNFLAEIDEGVDVPAESFVAKSHEMTRSQIDGILGETSQTSGEQIRVRADMLDKLVNYAAEVSISRSRIEQQMGNVRWDLGELEQTVDRVREQLRRMDMETEAQIRYRTEEISEHGEQFDPLEFDRYSNVQQLSRSLGESMSDLVSIRDHLDNLTSESETLLLQQSRVNTELQEGLMRTRLVGFAGLVPRLRRVIRQTARELNKQVDLRVIGADVELDRTVLDRMAGPLEHMLRNAIDHGIELPDDRRNKGKKESGVIAIKLVREGTEVAIQVQDDGKGMNVDAIRTKASKLGMMNGNAALTNTDILQFILEPGFSTASKVTQISGRGVGLDVVSNEIKQLGGTLQIDTVADKGSMFMIRLPLTLSVSQALIVQITEEMYAIPLSSIVGITRIKRDDLLRAFSTGNPSFNYAGHNYQLQYLGTTLGTEFQTQEEEIMKLPILLVHSGGHRVAFQVDALVGSREIVVKPVGPQLSTIHGIAGATIMGDGRVVLILDVAALVRRGIIRTELHAPKAERVDEPISKGVKVMVVDDSITVRKVTSRFLERHQMDVTTAKDGVDALGKLQDYMPDVILLDIEMPRMDGYELASVIRNDDRLKDIPIIMITSRTGSKHRDRAMQIGVNIYMGKPYQEHELIENIHSLLRERR